MIQIVQGEELVLETTDKQTEEEEDVEIDVPKDESATTASESEAETDLGADEQVEEMADDDSLLSET